jgi:hypothetical protein
VPKGGDRVGRVTPSSLIIRPSKTGKLTSHFSGHTYCETAYRRSGLVHAELRVHLYNQLDPSHVQITCSLVTSSWHGLPKVDHLVPMSTILVVEPDQHESSLLISLRVRRLLTPPIPEWYALIVPTQRDEAIIAAYQLPLISKMTDRHTIRCVPTLSQDIDSDRGACSYFLSVSRMNFRDAYRDSSSTIPSSGIAASL